MARRGEHGVSKRPSILIADDDAGYRYPIGVLFEDAGYEVAEADCQEQVVAKAVSCDIWIIDVRLPTRKMEGILAVQELVKRDIPPKYPVIFISVLRESYAEAELAKLREAEVAYQWLEKPFDLELLEHTVADLLRKGNR